MVTASGWKRTAAGVALVGVAALNGCGHESDRGLKLRAVTLSDFAQPRENAVQSASSAPQAPEAAVADANSATATTASAPPAPRPTLSPRPLKPGEQIYVDSVVGQVSGRPIFADALLEPIADRLRREREQSKPGEFPARAKRIIDDRLREVVLNELFIAESEASLSTQQQQGLLWFLKNLREKTVAGALGSETRSEQRLQDEQGVSLDQYIAMRKNEVLIQNLLYQKIAPRVIVSWRDVEREYERRKAEFNPPAKVTLQRLRLSGADQAELVEQVKSRLAAGESFGAIVSSLGQSASTLGPFVMGPGGIADIEINAVYKPALEGLTLSQTTQPIELNERNRKDVVWLHVAQIDEPPQRTLYDVQRQLIAEIEQRRREEERIKYIQSLLEKGNYDHMDEMSRRVLTVALLRYGM